MSDRSILGTQIALYDTSGSDLDVCDTPQTFSEIFASTAATIRLHLYLLLFSLFRPAFSCSAVFSFTVKGEKCTVARFGFIW
jgi:hypothetical protein